MTDLTLLSPDELSQLVFNTESLYVLRDCPKQLKQAIDETYEYTEDQFKRLEQDIQEYVMEELEFAAEFVQH